MFKKSKTTERLFTEELKEEAPLVVVDEHGIERPGLEIRALAASVQIGGQRRQRRWAQALAFAGCIALALAFWKLAPAVLSAFTIFTGVPTAQSQNKCTFADGSSREGACMWEDTMAGSSVDATKWTVAGAANGGTDNANAIIVTDNSGCVASANATVSGGVMSLAVTANSRSAGQCPASWTATSYYNTNYSSFPVGGATSWDTAWISQKTFQFTYGYVTVVAQMTAGTGPGSTITLQGVNCQNPGGSIGASMAGPLFTGGTGSCNWPTNAPEMDIADYTTSNTDMVSTVYTGNVGGAPLVGTTFNPPVSYYGKQFGSLGTAYMNSFTVSNPTTTYHTYAVDWRPGSVQFYVDGAATAAVTASWVPSVPMSIYMFNQNVTPTTVGGTFKIKSVRITCPSGVPCSWSGG